MGQLLVILTKFAPMVAQAWPLVVQLLALLANVDADKMKIAPAPVGGFNANPETEKCVEVCTKAGVDETECRAVMQNLQHAADKQSQQSENKPS